jgi:hypothetical protein
LQILQKRGIELSMHGCGYWVCSVAVSYDGFGKGKLCLMLCDLRAKRGAVYAALLRKLSPENKFSISAKLVRCTSSL